METRTLEPIEVSLGQYRNRCPVRKGFKDHNGQVYLPPENSRRLEFWAHKLMGSQLDVVVPGVAK